MERRHALEGEEERVDEELEELELEERYNEAVALGKGGDELSLHRLLELAADEHRSVRCAAAVSLGAYPESREAMEALVELLADPEPWVRVRAVQSLGRMVFPDAVDHVVQYLEGEEDEKVRATMVKVIGSKAREGYLSILVRYLDDDDARVRANTLEGLSYYPPELVKDLVEETASDANNRVRANAARLMASFDERRARELFEQMLSSGDHFERASAVYVLGEMRRREYLDRLVSLLGDPSFVVRRNVMDALCKFGSAVEKQMIGILDDPDSVKRADACRVLGRVGGKKALRALIPHLEDSDGEVRAACEEAVFAIRKRVVG